MSLTSVHSGMKLDKQLEANHRVCGEGSPQKAAARAPVAELHKHRAAPAPVLRVTSVIAVAMAAPVMAARNSPLGPCTYTSAVLCLYLSEALS